MITLTQKNFNTAFLVAFLITLTILSRFMGHAWNFTILGGVALFSGLYFSARSLSIFIVFASLLVSDFFIGYHNQMPGVYLGFLGMILIASALNLKSPRFKILGFSILGSLFFYLFTNFFVWFEGALYPLTVGGLVNCYVMGLPFFQNQFAADVITLFVLVEVAKQVNAFAQVKLNTNLIKSF